MGMCGFIMKKTILIIFMCGFIVLSIISCVYNSINNQNANVNDDTVNNNELINHDEDSLKDEKEILDISSKDYGEKIGKIFNSITSNNEVYEYQGFTSHYPYLQISLYPIGKFDKEVIKREAKDITNNVLQELRKYKFKTGGFFKYNYEYLNIYFYDYDEYGNISRNGGPFAQINVLDIENINIDECFNE